MRMHCLFQFSPVSLTLPLAGTLTLAKWCEAMETATHLGLPWRLLRERLAPPDPDYVATCVHYNKTLELLDSDFMVSTHFLSRIASGATNCPAKLLTDVQPHDCRPQPSHRNRTLAPPPSRTRCTETKAAWKRFSASWIRTIPDRSPSKNSVRRATYCTNTCRSTRPRRSCSICAR